MKALLSLKKKKKKKKNSFFGGGSIRTSTLSGVGARRGRRRRRRHGAASPTGGPGRVSHRDHRRRGETPLDSGAGDERRSRGREDDHNSLTHTRSPSTTTTFSRPRQDTVTGFLLAGVGHKDYRQNTNFLIVDTSKHTSSLERIAKKFRPNSLLLLQKKISVFDRIASQRRRRRRLSRPSRASPSARTLRSSSSPRTLQTRSGTSSSGTTRPYPRYWRYRPRTSPTTRTRTPC